MKEPTVHLVSQGDSLGLTTIKVACGVKPAMKSEGYFGWDGTIHRITCGACKKTKLYRELSKED